MQVTKTATYGCTLHCTLLLHNCTNRLQDYHIIISRDKGGTSSSGHDWFSGLEAECEATIATMMHYALYADHCCYSIDAMHYAAPNPNIKLQ